MSSKITKALVLKVTLRHDNNHIVRLFNHNGVFDLVANGLHKPLSKNRANLHPGSIVEIEYFGARLKGSIGRLKTANMMQMFDMTNYSNSSYFNSLEKLFSNIKESNHLFELYLRTFEYLSKDNNKKLLTFFYAQSMFYFGINPSYDGCRICKSRNNLISFDLYKGGFLCNKHFIEVENDSVEYLSAVWASFNSFKRYLTIVSYNMDYNLKKHYKNVIREAGFYI
ncbi:DNA repair protein RecO [Mycoplasmopsis edwardii]|uniref:DNA repair protein RecO n=1 Tax=Mycoplasmopsis edwardii TaxID=53558 RepID=A0ACD4PHM6_9BACT|nr:DNA repair protein RecO [Mycoplasmopsis edwardii]WBP84135.1 DNA repair protein RecO [Mycoplasmopsis edwardii]